jgi:hypothetical protein
VGHRRTSAAEGAAHARRESERTQEHPEGDADDRADRRGASEVVDEETEERATDDAADDDATETEEVTSAQRRGLLVIWHRPKLSQREGSETRAVGPGRESRIAVVNIGGRSVS